MRILQNRFVAILIVLAVILFSAVLGTSLSLSREEDKLLELYENGSDGSGRGLEAYIVEIMGQCENMLTLAGRYSDIDSAMTQELRVVLDELSAQTGSGTAQKQTVDALYAAAGALDMQLFNQPLSDEDRTLLNKVTANIDSAYLIVGREQESYNSAVEEYNRKLETFPASFFNSFVGWETAEPFV